MNNEKYIKSDIYTGFESCHDFQSRLNFLFLKLSYDVIAVKTDKSVRQLKRYANGAEVPFNIVAKVSELSGISLNEIFNGLELKPHKIDQKSHDTMKQVDTKAITRVAKFVTKLYKSLGRHLNNEDIIYTAADIYNVLLHIDIDFNDQEELDAAINLEIIKLKKRLIAGGDNDAIYATA